MNKKYLLFFAVVIFYLITRLYKITEIPNSLYWDEASIAVNAYSILTSGMDEWGKMFPLHFRAFSEFKLPVFIYSVSLFQTILGLTTLSVRLPSVIFGLGVLVVAFLITKRFTKNFYLSLIASLLLTITPWFWIFSRAGYEAVEALMIFYFGFYFYLKSEENFKYYLISVFLFCLSMYTYNSYRIIVPLFLALTLFNKKFLTQAVTNKKIVIVSLIIFISATLPIFRFTIGNNGGGRLQTVGIFKEQKSGLEILGIFSENYLSHFTPEYLFINGDKNIRSHVPGFGEIYIWYLPFFLIGFWYIVMKKGSKGLLSIFLLSFIPSAITNEAPHSLRTLSALPALVIIMMIGIENFKIKFKKQLIILFISVCLVNFLWFYKAFLVNYSIKSNGHWQQTYKTLFTNYSINFKEYNYIYISDHYAQPYIFALFYLNYPTSEFRKTVAYNSPDRWGESLVSSFNKYKFDKLDMIGNFENNSLIFSIPEENLLDKNLQKIGEISLEDKVVFEIYEKK